MAIGSALGGWAAAIAHPLGLQGTLRVATHDVVLPPPPAAATPTPPLRVAFASDLHAGTATHPRMLAAACDAIASARPDLVARIASVPRSPVT